MPPTLAPGYVVAVTNGDVVLRVEFLDDDLLHLELAPGASAPVGAIPTSPMVLRNDYPGPSRLRRTEDGAYETAALRVEIDPERLCIASTDLAHDPPLALAEICPYQMDQEVRGVTFQPGGFTHVYGLGQKFIEPGNPDGDWTGRERLPGEFGNVMEPFHLGAAGNTQFPILYFVGSGTDSFAVFFDDVHRQFFDFAAPVWQAAMEAQAVRFYLLAGEDLRDLRSDYLELTGRPPVPPKKMFGLWVSEYGFESWAEVWDKLSTLREADFPVDGFVLDLQWYGGIQSGSDTTRMGSLTWDDRTFADPYDSIARLRSEQGIGLITIEQPYVGRDLPEYQDLASHGYLVRACETCPPVYLTDNPWWGQGGMIDWTNAEAAAYWHDLKREPLIRLGIIGHWTDLGEPEAFDPTGWYASTAMGPDSGHTHAETHNLYNLLWTRSIFEGYARNGHLERPFVLTRSGAPGSQRYGAALWSGDLAGVLENLAAQFNAQMHVSLSGVDYYGSDVGGFWRQDVDIEETYTQWFASSAAIDVPLRPHAFNLDNAYETAPDRIGDVASNLDNLRQRYRLTPYLYSLAHEAFRHGEAVFPPLVYHFMSDPVARELGSEKMIGGNLLVALAAEEGIAEREVYLPQGTWFDFHAGTAIESRGEWMGPVPLYTDGRLRLPMYARSGAIIPLMYVDDQTMNVLGLRADGSVRDELIVRVYAGREPSSFTLYEDDGVTTAYQHGEVRTTIVRQDSEDEVVLITIEAAQGSYQGASVARQNVIELVRMSTEPPFEVLLNGEILPRLVDEREFEAADRGWIVAPDGSARVKSGVLLIDVEKAFGFRFAP